jgi:hypothetical protein
VRALVAGLERQARDTERYEELVGDAQ